MSVDLGVIKSTMTCIHIILGNNTNKHNTFDSIDDLLESITASLESNLTSENGGGFYGEEILESFHKSIEWMKDRCVITILSDNSMNKPIIVINKDKLIAYIIDPDPPGDKNSRYMT